MKDILTGLLSKAYNLDTERIAELLYKKADDGTLTEEVAEDALQALINIDVQRAAKLKEDAKKRFDDGHKKGTSETATKTRGEEGVQ
jgi:predicted transcriptional regulator